MNTKKVLLGDIRFNMKNPRTIKGEKFDKLINSILIFPKMLDIRPIVVNKQGEILGGNMRCHALQEIESLDVDLLARRIYNLRKYQEMPKEVKSELLTYWEAWLANPQVTIIEADDLTEEEEVEFIVKDNAPFGEWDWDMLASDFDNDLLNEWGLDVWDAKMDDTTEDLGSEKSSEGGEVDRDSATTMCQLGDLWEMGDTTLLCGEYTDINLDLLVGSHCVEVERTKDFLMAVDADEKKVFILTPNPKVCDVIIKSWERLTNTLATKQ